MRFVWRMLVVSALVPACGCLTVERAALRIRYDPEKRVGTSEQRFENFQSDEKSPEGQRKDFEELLEDASGDRYLLERVREGAYVKQRRLELRGGVLVGSETALFGDLSAVSMVRDSTGAVSWTDRGFEVVATNGRASAGRDTVWWVPGTTVFELDLRNREFKPTSDFAKWYKERR